MERHQMHVCPKCPAGKYQPLTSQKECYQVDKAKEKEKEKEQEKEKEKAAAKAAGRSRGAYLAALKQEQESCELVTYRCRCVRAVERQARRLLPLRHLAGY
jgi:phage/plasmid primase-like uncharacterized protein